MALSDEVYEAEAFETLSRDIGPLPVETTEAERPAHLRVAPDSVELLRRRRRARLIVVLGAAISAASMFLLVAFHVFAVQSSFQLDKLQTQLTAEQRRYGMLRDEVADALVGRDDRDAAPRRSAWCGPIRSPCSAHRPRSRSAPKANFPSRPPRRTTTLAPTSRGAPPVTGRARPAFGPGGRPRGSRRGRAREPEARRRRVARSPEQRPLPRTRAGDSWRAACWSCSCSVRSRCASRSSRCSAATATSGWPSSRRCTPCRFPRSEARSSTGTDAISRCRFS